jgi:signal transduction histidine kinase
MRGVGGAYPRPPPTREPRPALFEPYLTSRAGGFGADLEICRAIVEMHGGELGTEDGDGGGTVVWFTVPAAETIDPE